MSTSTKLALLIDADNASAALIGPMLEEVAKYGVATIKRAYGDWTTPNLGSWKATLLEHSIQPIQQFRYTVGKNASDSALIIDAMDLLHGHQLNAACIVSSDSDFTRLASRLREGGLFVVGIGERKTPRPFVAACDKFVFTDLLVPAATAPGAPVKAKPAADSDLGLVELLNRCVDTAADDDGWAQLGEVGNQLNRIQPDFDPRSHGFQKLGQLVESMKSFEVRRTPVNERGQVRVEVRRRSTRARARRGAVS